MNIISLLHGRVQDFAVTIDPPKRAMGALRRNIGIAPGVKAAFPVAIHAPRLHSPVKTA